MDELAFIRNSRSLLRNQKARNVDIRPRHKRPSNSGSAYLKAQSTKKPQHKEDSPGAAYRQVRSIRSARLGGRPPLPSNTLERQRIYQEGSPQRFFLEPEVPTFHGRDAINLAPANGAFPWRVGNAPDADLYEDVPVFNTGGRRSFYGNYVGPSNFFGENAPPPLTPVDRAAWYHDREYGDIYNRYGYSDFEFGLSFATELDRIFGTDFAENQGAVGALGWLGQVNSFDPMMQIELAWADTKLIGRSIFGIGEGLFTGFYSGARGQRALGTDLAWGVGISLFHIGLIAWRLGVMVPIGITYQLLRGATSLIRGLGKAVGGDVGKLITSVGDFADNLVVGAGQILHGLVTVASVGWLIGTGVIAGIAGGAVYVASEIVEGIGNFIGGIADSAGCYITSAVVQTTREGPHGHTLQTLRMFRNQYVQHLSDGPVELEIYDAVAPKIVAAIEKRADNHAVWMHVRTEYIDKAIRLIDQGANHAAFDVYKLMFLELLKLTGVRVEVDSGHLTVKKPGRVSRKSLSLPRD